MKTVGESVIMYLVFISFPSCDLAKLESSTMQFELNSQPKSIGLLLTAQTVFNVRPKCMLIISDGVDKHQFLTRIDNFKRPFQTGSLQIQIGGIIVPLVQTGSISKVCNLIELTFYTHITFCCFLSRIF